MQKFTAVSMMMLLMGCTSHQTNQTRVEQDYYEAGGSSVDYKVSKDYEVVPVQNIVLQPDEEIQKLQNIEIKSITGNTFTQDGGYIDSLNKKLRKEFRMPGVKVKEISGQIDLIIPTKVAFGNNQQKLQNDFVESFSNVAKLLKEYEATMIQIIGYTDNSGSVLENKEASLKRADVIADYLKGQGINSERIITDGAGSENPVGNNETVAGRELNRRIELTIISLK